MLRHRFNLVSADLGMDCFKFEGEVNFKLQIKKAKKLEEQNLGETKDISCFQISGSSHF